MDNNKYNYINQILDRFTDGYFNHLEMHSMIQDITDNFNQTKLNYLKNDIESKIYGIELFIDIYSSEIENPKENSVLAESKLNILYLKDTVKYIDTLIEDVKNINATIPKLQWEGSQTELIELLKSLIESKKIKGTQTEIIKAFCLFLGVEIKNPSKLINDIKNRKNGNETLFLNNLQISLMNFIINEKP